MKQTRQYRIAIGIDPGTKTGLAVWNIETKSLHSVATMPIHDAMAEIWRLAGIYDGEMLVRIEDARLRTWFGKRAKEKEQGAGSIKRDCTIWEDYLRAMDIDFELAAPEQNMTKLFAFDFNKFTGWKGRTSNHARDAAMLVFNYRNSTAKKTA